MSREKKDADLAGELRAERRRFLKESAAAVAGALLFGGPAWAALDGRWRGKPEVAGCNRHQRASMWLAPGLSGTAMLHAVTAVQVSGQDTPLARMASIPTGAVPVM